MQKERAQSAAGAWRKTEKCYSLSRLGSNQQQRGARALRRRSRQLSVTVRNGCRPFVINYISSDVAKFPVKRSSTRFVIVRKVADFCSNSVGPHSRGRLTHVMSYWFRLVSVSPTSLRSVGDGPKRILLLYSLPCGNNWMHGVDVAKSMQEATVCSTVGYLRYRFLHVMERDGAENGRVKAVSSRDLRKRFAFMYASSPTWSNQALKIALHAVLHLSQPVALTPVQKQAGQRRVWWYSRHQRTAV